MKYLRNIVTQKFENFSYFFKYLRYKIFISLAISILVGMLDAFGLTMFLPLLQMVSGSEVNAEQMGNLSFVVEFMTYLGLELTLATALLFMLIFFTLKGIAKYFSSMYDIIIQQYFIRQIRISTLDNLNSISYNHFVTSDVGRIQNTMTGEVDNVADAYHFYFKTFQNGIMLLVYMSFAFFVNWQFAILVAIGGWLTNFLYKAIYQYTAEASKELTDYNHVYQGEVIQHIANYKYLRATGLVSEYGKKLKNTIFSLEKYWRKINFLSAILNSVREPMLMAVVAGVILLQTQVLHGNLSYVLISLLFFYRSLTSLTQLQTYWNHFLASSGSLENMKKFQAELTAHKEKNGLVQLPGFTKKIELQNVSFSYGETNVLKNINLHIKRNETIAFVGKSGSGKTTLVNLICGLLLPERGEISADDFNYQQLDINSLQKRIGYITQEPVIFNDSIYNNVTFWASKTTENIARFEKAIQKAAIAQFIVSLPEKENTQLGNNGINLSGGQKQRISIARELFKDIDILIMDEATSSLDSETEKIIQDQIEALHGNYTILIIAHRLSTIKNADRVILMDNGEIKNIGTFKELLEQDPDFKLMVNTQML
jgi:ABC-type multidrug transport system fused ATPase/permease subunit